MTKANSPSRSKRKSAKPVRSRVPSNPKRTVTPSPSTSGKSQSTAAYQRNYRLRKMFEPKLQASALLRLLTDEEVRQVVNFMREMRPDLVGDRL